MSDLSTTSRRFCERFEVDVPIVNAPMAFIAGGALAAAVADAGGLGLIGGGYGDADWIDGQRQIASGDRPPESIGVGLITWALAEQRGLVEHVLDTGFVTLCFSFGDPTPYLGAVRAAAGRSICQVQSVAEALRVADAGADAIVVQGTEAGGHGRDNDGVARLTPRVVESLASRGLDTPVLAAGGIATAADVRTACGWGAAGVMVGTRFYATYESLDIHAAKRRLVEADSGDTARTTVFDAVRGPRWPIGYDGRALRNDLVDRWERDPSQFGQPEIRSYAAAAVQGDLSQRVVWAGTGVGRITGLADAGVVVADLATGLCST
jgi:nitronate monooxygenase